jgi:hypothetical protein
MSEREWPRLRAENLPGLGVVVGRRCEHPEEECCVDWHTTAEITGDSPEEEERLARLFAQAPVLYEATREAILSLEAHERSYPCVNLGGPCGVCLALSELRAALVGIEAPAPAAPTPPTPTPSCSHPACPRPPLSGGKRCEAHELAGRECLVAGCPNERSGPCLTCPAHLAAWQRQPGEGVVAFRAWLARVGAEAPGAVGRTHIPQDARVRIVGGHPNEHWWRVCRAEIENHSFRVGGGGLTRGADGWWRGDLDEWPWSFSDGVRLVQVVPARTPVSPQTQAPTPVPVPASVTTHGCEAPGVEMPRCPGRAAPGRRYCEYHADRYGEGVPVPGSPGNAYTTHGAPVGEDAGEMEQALRQAPTPSPASDLRGLAAREAQVEDEEWVSYEENAEQARSFGLQPRLQTWCLWINTEEEGDGCEKPREPGSAFCDTHEHLGAAALHREFMDALPPEEREAERAEIERLVNVGRDIIAERLGAALDGCRSTPILPPGQTLTILSPCVNAQCPERAPRLPGSAFCAGCKP